MRGAGAPDSTTDASTGESFRTPSGAFQGRMAAVRSTPECESHDLADTTSRPAFSTPRFCARRPTTNSGSGFQGSASEPAGKSVTAGIYSDEGNRGSSRTSPALTSCGISIRPTSGVSSGSASGLISVYARAELVVPRSIPITYFIYSISISAGAMIVESCLAFSGGRSILAARQPLWRNRPPDGFPAGTLPTNFTAVGSDEAGLVKVPSTPSMTGSSFT